MASFRGRVKDAWFTQLEDEWRQPPPIHRSGHQYHDKGKTQPGEDTTTPTDEAHTQVLSEHGGGTGSASRGTFPIKLRHTHSESCRNTLDNAKPGINLAQLDATQVVLANLCGILQILLLPPFLSAGLFDFSTETHSHTSFLKNIVLY
jgi:hypothetical protein